jgi:uncharacterized integral membrane protein
MRIRGTLFTIVVLLSLLFAVTNWEAVTTPLPVHLLFTRVELPLGLVLLLAVLVLSTFFFFASLLDRSAQLRQVSHLERQIEQLQEKLERKRQEELEGIERAFRERSDKLEGTFEEGLDALEQALSKKLADRDDRIAELEERLAALES